MSDSDYSTDVYGATGVPSAAGPDGTAEIPLDSIDVLGLLGTEIHGGFIVEELVSSDGLSMVYRALGPAGTQAALKCFYGLRELSDDSLSTFRDRFRRITSLLGGLAADHASMTKVLGQGWMQVGTKDIPCMLLEWVPGVSMQVVLDAERSSGRKRRDAHETFRTMFGPIRALAAAHAYGLTHRNINPANLFVDGVSGVLDEGVNVRIIDYALARLEGEPFDDATTFLTPEYAAPEQFMGWEHLVGPWTDVFSMALVLTEIMLGGGQVMPGGSFEELREACLDEDRRPTPRTFGLDVPDGVELVFRRALDVNINERFPTGAHFMGALSRALEPEANAESGRIGTAGSFLHNPSDYLTRSRRGPKGSVTAPQMVVDPKSAVITGETVISPTPARTGNTVLAPVPQSPSFDEV